ncbi:unnamed protein product [Aphanomyces euteiches]
MEAGLAPPHPNPTLAISILRTIARWTFYFETPKIEGKYDTSITKRPGSHGAHIDIKLDERMQRSVEEAIQRQEEATKPLASLRHQKQERWDATETERQADNMAKLEAMAPIESPRQGQIKRGSPIHSPTNASQQQQKGSFMEDPLLSVSSGINIQANQTSRHPPSDSQPSARQYQNETSEKINMHAFRESINGPIYKMIHELSKAMNEHLTNTSNAMAMVNQRLSAQEIHQGNMPNTLKSLMEETNKTQMNKLEEIFKKQYSSLDALVVGLDERVNQVKTSQVRLEDQIQDLQVKHAQQEAASSSWRASIEQSIEFLAKQIPKKTTQIPPTSFMSGTYTVTPTSAPATAQQTSQTTPNASWPNQGSNPGTPRDKKRQPSEGPGGRSGEGGDGGDGHGD